MPVLRAALNVPRLSRFRIEARPEMPVMPLELEESRVAKSGWSGSVASRGPDRPTGRRARDRDYVEMILEMFFSTSGDSRPSPATCRNFFRGFGGPLKGGLSRMDRLPPVATMRRSSGMLATPGYDLRRDLGRSSHPVRLPRAGRTRKFCGLREPRTVLPLRCTGRKPHGGTDHGPADR